MTDDPLDRLQTEFVSMVSHELRTPLTAISSSITGLIRRWNRMSEADKLEYLAMAEGSTQRLLRLVDDLLFIARIEDRRLTMRLEPCDVMPAVAAVVAELRAQFPAQEIVVDATPDLPAVRADNDRLRQLLANLLSNACRHGGGPPIHVSCTHDGAMVTVAMRDQGPGISAEAQRRLFKRFSRLAALEGRHEGLGVGLYISHHLVEGMGGRIWFETTPGVGTSFLFSLPAANRSA